MSLLCYKNIVLFVLKIKDGTVVRIRMRSGSSRNLEENELRDGPEERK